MRTLEASPLEKSPAHLEGQSTWLSTITSAKVLGHPLVWSAMTALFILGGYLWLQFYALPIAQNIENAHPDDLLIGAQAGNNWNPEIYQPIVSNERMPITQQADQLRADEYRQLIDLENKIKPLLALARNRMRAEIYTDNHSNNAWSAYQEILGLDSKHKLALLGQSQILQILTENAEIAIQEKQYELAERWLNQLDVIQANHPFQTEMRQSIAQGISAELLAAETAQRKVERLQRLKATLDDALSAMSATPIKLRVAYDLYSRALEIDIDNASAQSGLRQIHLKRSEIAKLAIARAEFNSAIEQIERLQETGADPKLVADLNSLLNLAQVRSQQLNNPQTGQESADLEVENLDSVFLISNENTDRGETPPLSDNVAGVETSEIEVQQAALPKLSVSDQNAPLISPSQNNQLLQLTEGIDAYYTGNYNTAFEKLHPLAEDDIARAQFRIGIMYYQGRTVVKNIDLANQWIVRALPTVLRASQNGEAWAQTDLGTAYELGVGLKKDVKHSASLYQRAADQGYGGAQTNLGVLFGTGDGVKYDRQLALYWLKRAAEQGDKVAQDNLNILNAR